MKNETDDQLPTARMVTITRTSFWIYFSVCAILFVCSLFTPRHPMADWAIPSSIALCIFADLFLELIRQRQKVEKTANVLVTISWLLEGISVIIFAWLIIFG